MAERKTSHVFHLLMMLLTCGAWMIVWGLVLIIPDSYVCPICGTRVKWTYF